MMSAYRRTASRCTADLVDALLTHRCSASRAAGDRYHDRIVAGLEHGRPIVIDRRDIPDDLFEEITRHDKPHVIFSNAVREIAAISMGATRVDAMVKAGRLKWSVME